MSLQVKYSPEEDIFLAATSERGEGSYDVENHYWTTVILPFGGGHKPVALEIMFASDLMPLEKNGGYCGETDTLVIGEGKGAATLVEENGDLAAYWLPEDGPEDLNLVGVSLRNASKHLAPVIAGHCHSRQAGMDTPP